MQMEVERNAFGRQRESFQIPIKIKGFNQQFDAVFIRSPIIKRVWGSCDKLAMLNGKIVAAKQGKFLAISFHPELTDDTRIHEYFLRMI
jgi:5'-phosphate synthase pdxT subunit